MLQHQRLELGYADEPAVIDLDPVVAVDPAGWRLHELAGLAIQVSRIDDSQVWQADLRGSFHYLGIRQQPRISNAPIDPLLLAWERPEGSGWFSGVNLIDGDQLRLGVNQFSMLRQGHFNNNLWIRAHNGRPSFSLMDFLRVGYRDQKFGIEVLHEDVVASVEFHTLDEDAGTYQTDPPRSEITFEELCKAAILPPDFDRDLSNEQILTFLNRHRRTLNAVFHPDAASSDSEERAKCANDALDKLIEGFTV